MITLRELHARLSELLDLPAALNTGAMRVELAWKWKQGASQKASEIVGVALEPTRITILIVPNERETKP